MITVNRAELARELQLLQPIVRSKETIPVLSTVLVEFKDNLRLTASNLDTTLSTEIAVPVVGMLGVEAESYCLPLRQLHSLVKLFEAETVTLTRKLNDRVAVVCGKSKHLLPSLPVEQFPEIDKVAGDVTCTLGGPTLQQALERVLPCVTKEESRYNLAGVNLEAKDDILSVVATDGHRLGLQTLPLTSKPFTALVPTESIYTLLPLLEGETTLTITENHLCCVVGTHVFTARLLSGSFPNWRMIMPASLAYHVEIAAPELIAVVKRVALTRAEVHSVSTGQYYGGIKLTFAGEMLTVATAES